MPEGLRDTAPAAASSHPAGPPGVLAGPIVPTLLRLALPTVVVLVIQTLVGYQWIVGGTMLELFYFSAQRDQLIFRSITVTYKAI